MDFLAGQNTLDCLTKFLKKNPYCFKTGQSFTLVLDFIPKTFDTVSHENHLNICTSMDLEVQVWASFDIFKQ